MLNKLKKKLRYIAMEIWIPGKGDIEFVLKTRAEAGSVFFIQIGSFDGQTNDPLYGLIKRFNWKGVFVEPMAKPMVKLKRTHRGLGFSFEQSAVNSSNEEKEFYYINNPKADFPKWFNQISALDKKYLMLYKDRIPEIEKHLASKKVKCITFNSLLDKYAIKKVDLLHIDAEGSDFKIIQTIDFNKIKPKLILFEHKSIYLNWVSRYFVSFIQYLKCLRLLKQNGYIFFRQEGDTLAILIS